MAAKSTKKKKSETRTAPPPEKTDVEQTEIPQTDIEQSEDQSKTPEEPITESTSSSPDLSVDAYKIDKPLQDNIRHFFYEHIFNCLDQTDPEHKKVILDIGSRDSKWPAFLAKAGHAVFAVDRCDGFTGSQAAIMTNWDTQDTVAQQDVTGMSATQEFHFILDIFAIQHNGDTDHDIASWLHCANMLAKGGFITIVVKYNHLQGSVQKGRSDGDMRTYSQEDVERRIITPLRSALPDLIGVIAEPVLFDFKEQTVGFTDNLEQANSLWLVLQRR